MVREPATPSGQLIRSVAHRDNESFSSWRAKFKLDEDAQETFFDLIFAVFSRLVLLRFQSLTNEGKVREFVQRERRVLWPNEGFDQDKAERIVRSALGERGRLTDLSAIEGAQLRLQIITYLSEDMSLVDDQIVQLIVEGEQAVAAAG